MPNYRYTARDERGKAVTGTLLAPTPEVLTDQLKRMGYLVTHSREFSEGATIEGLLQRMRGVSADEMGLFNVQLSKMVQVGIPLVTALDTLTQQTERTRLREAIGDVARNVEAGTEFSEALQRHPAIFSGFFISMVRSGEVSGKLDEILRRLATFAKRQAEFRQQLMTALTYPALLLVVGLAVCGFLVVGIIPKFMKIFLEAGVPLPTQLLYQLSVMLRQYWLLLGAGLIAVIMGLQAYVRTRQGRRQFDTALLRVPLIGDLARQAAVSRLARTLETLLSSGVPVLEALAIAEQTCGNAVIADVCQAAQTSVRGGGTISEPLDRSRSVPPMVVQMLRVGEASGTMDHMLAEIADHYDEVIQHSLKRMMALVEPLFLMVMGGLVAFIMASILLPMFRMVNVVR